LLFSLAKQAEDERGSCVIVDASQPLPNCAKICLLQQGTAASAPNRPGRPGMSNAVDTTA
jgi:hypothetical protein